MQRIVLCLFGSGWLLGAAPAGAADWSDFIERPTLTGDWGGWRDPFADLGLTTEFVYTADVFSNLAGGERRGTSYLDNFDLTLTWDAADVAGWEIGTFFVYGLANHGKDPSEDAGDSQGLDNIAAPQSIKLYEAWWQRAFFRDYVSLLVGLYDLNSEFDSIESGALFINGSFGSAAELGQSGVNGASIFPFTSLTARGKVMLLEQIIVQVAVLDGVPGDPSDDRGTQIILDRDDGVLVVAEVDYFLFGEGFQDQESSARARRRRVGRGWGEPPYVLKLAAGAWVYSKDLDRVDRTRPDGTPIDEQSHPGAYLLADWDAYSEDERSLQGLSVFARIGFADGDVQQYAGFAGGGLVYTGPIPGRDEDRVGIAVAAVRNGAPFQRSVRASGRRPSDWEVAIETTYRAELTGWLAVQPDLHIITDPGGLDRSAAVVLGIRSEVAF